MDYRKRQYYLIDIKDDHLNHKFNMMKQLAPSLKMSPPYNHFKDGLDWDYRNIGNRDIIDLQSITHLVSISNKHHYIFRQFLELATKANEIRFIRVDKSMLGH